VPVCWRAIVNPICNSQVRKILYKYTAVIIMLLLTACSSLPVAVVTDEPISSYQAVVQLVNDAQVHIKQNQPEKAKGSLERALRIEPNNAYIWFELAKVNRAQGNDREASSLALKAKSLSAGNTRLRQQISAFVDRLHQF
jgi:Tfp pilus assembly protein PilF